MKCNDCGFNPYTTNKKALNECMICYKFFCNNCFYKDEHKCINCSIMVDHS